MAVVPEAQVSPITRGTHMAPALAPQNPAAVPGACDAAECTGRCAAASIGHWGRAAGVKHMGAAVKQQKMVMTYGATDSRRT